MQKQLIQKWCLFDFAGVAGCCAKSTVAPFDRVKILLQAHNKHYKHLGMFCINFLAEGMCVGGGGGIYLTYGFRLGRSTVLLIIACEHFWDIQELSSESPPPPPTLFPHVKIQHYRPTDPWNAVSDLFCPLWFYLTVKIFFLCYKPLRFLYSTQDPTRNPPIQ